MKLATTDNQTALLYACQYSICELELIEQLLEHGSDVINSRDHEGKTALHYASERSNVQIVKMLLDYGAYVNVLCNNGCNPLHVVCRNIHRPTARECGNMLLGRGRYFEG